MSPSRTSFFEAQDFPFEELVRLGLFSNQQLQILRIHAACEANKKLCLYGIDRGTPGELEALRTETKILKNWLHEAKDALLIPGDWKTPKSEAELDEADLS